MRALRSTPLALVGLLCAAYLLALVWAAVVPPWQSPDENSHFAYAQSMAERLRPAGDPSRPFYSTEQLRAVEVSNVEQTSLAPMTKPEWSAEAYARWHRTDDALPDAARADGGGRNPADLNPPLYYLYAAGPYLLASSGDVFDRVHLVRAFSALMLLVTVSATWALVGEVLGRDPLLQLAGAGFSGLEPMVSFLSASVHPDGMLIALTSAVLYFGVRLIRRGPSRGRVAALVGVLALALLTKPVALALVPAAMLAYLISRRRGSAQRSVSPAAAALLILTTLTVAGLAVILAPGEARAAFAPRLLGSYLWQFYLPELPFQREFGGLPGLPLYEVWLKTGWAAFGWLEVKLAEPVYWVLAVLSAGVLAAAAVAARRAGDRLDLRVLAFGLVAVAVTLVFLHSTEGWSLATGRGAVNQGRYLLPLVSLGGLALAGALTLAGRRLRPLLVAAVLGGLVVLQIASLGAVAARFYA